MDSVLNEILKSGLLGAIIVALSWYIIQLKKEIKEKETIIIDLLKEYSKEKLAEQKEMINTINQITLSLNELTKKIN